MYGGFAHMYDALTGDVDYAKFADYYFEVFRKFNLNPSLGLDLGCGTGSITFEMHNRGCDMIGVDISAEMLSVARQRSAAEKSDILFLNQDMTEFELYGTVSFAVSSLDCMNYITQKNSLKRVFKLVNNYLDPGGLFIFDMNTPYKLGKVLGDNTYIYEENDIFYTWQNCYDSHSRICDFYLTFFEKDKSGLYRRFDEVHSQRAYEIDEVVQMLEKSGMRVEGVFADKTFKKPAKTTERVFFVAREQGK